MNIVTSNARWVSTVRKIKKLSVFPSHILVIWAVIRSARKSYCSLSVSSFVMGLMAPLQIVSTIVGAKSAKVAISCGIQARFFAASLAQFTKGYLNMFVSTITVPVHRISKKFKAIISALLMYSRCHSCLVRLLIFSRISFSLNSAFSSLAMTSLCDWQSALLSILKFQQLKNI